MGCFLGCFGGGAKDSKRLKEKVYRGSPIHQRGRVRNVQQQQGVVYAEQSITETPPTEIPTTKLVSDLGDKPEEEEQLISSLRKRVTFDSNVTTYSHFSVNESTDSLPENNQRVEKFEEKDLERAQLENDSFVASNIGLYPPNHRYHNVMDGNDELEEYGDSDLDDLDEMDDQDDDEIAYEEVKSHLIKIAVPESQVDDFELTNARDKSDYVNSVLKPIENATQWQTVKSKGTMQQLKPQKENLVANLETPRIPFTSFEPTFKQSSHGLKPRLDQSKDANNEIAVDSSLSSWLVTPSKNSCSDCDTTSSAKNISLGSTSPRRSLGSTSPRSFDDRPILGALTVEELKQMSGSFSPRKSPGRNPDEMPIIGMVGTYWNDSVSDKNLDSASSFKGIPNTTSKYREDKRVNWHSTPFETRLERALNRGVAKS